MENQKANSYSLCNLNKTTQKAAAELTTLNAPFQHLGNHQRDQLYLLRKAVLLESCDGCSATSHTATPTRHSINFTFSVQKWQFLHFSHFGASPLILQNTTVLWKSSGLSTSPSVRLEHSNRRGQTKGQHTPAIQISNILTIQFSGTAVMRPSLAYLPDWCLLIFCS